MNMPNPAKPIREQEFLSRMRDGWLPFGWHAHPAYDGHRPLLDFEGSDEAGMPEWERPHGWEQGLTPIGEPRNATEAREAIEAIGRDALRRYHPTLAAEVDAELAENDRQEWPRGHPCRNCGELFWSHPTDSCPAWY